MKLRGAQRLLLVVLAVALIALVAWRFNWLPLAQRPADARSFLVSRLTEISGPKGTYCGTIPPNKPTAFSCLQSALETKSAFWFIEEMQGIDDLIVIGTASDTQGRVWQMSYASFAGRPSTELPQLLAKQCASPAIVKNQRPHFSCDGL